MNTPQTIWESDAKNHDGKSYISVKQNGHYCYAERLGVDSIAFILFDGKSNRYGLINERKPPLDEREGKEVSLITAFGGSLDSEHSPLQITIQEVKEEAGFTVTEDDIRYLGTSFVSTQMNQYCHLYFVDITNCAFTGRAPQTQMEADAEVKWLTLDEVVQGCDWKSISIVAKMYL